MSDLAGGGVDMKNFLKLLIRNLLLIVGTPALGIWIGHAVTRGGYNDFLFDSTSLLLYAVVAIALTYLLYGKLLRNS